MTAVAPRLLLAAGGATWESRLLPVLARPTAPVLLARRCVDVPDLVAGAAAGQGTVAAVAADLPGLDTDVLARLAESGVGTVLVAAPGPETDRVAGLGAGAVVDGTDPVRLLAVAAEVVAGAARPRAADRPEVDAVLPEPVGLGPVVAVWGPAGAPGRSTLALGLAAAAAADGTETLLVDVDVYGGATGQMLAVLDEVSGVLAAARAAATGTLDRTALAEAARRVGPRLRVLTGLPRADRWPALRPAALRQVLGRCREESRLVLVDCGFSVEQDEELSYDTAAPLRNGATRTALEEADLVVVVGSADPLGLARLARARDDVRAVVPGAPVRLVVNRVRPGLGWSRDDVARTLLQAVGEVPLGYLPLDQAAVDACWVHGRTLVEAAPGAPLTRAVAGLAATLSAELGLPAGPSHSAGRRVRIGRRRSVQK